MAETPEAYCLTVGEVGSLKPRYPGGSGVMLPLKPAKDPLLGPSLASRGLVANGVPCLAAVYSNLCLHWEKAFSLHCHFAYSTYVQSTSWEMVGWMKHKLESRLLGEIPTTSDMQMIPPLWQKEKRNQRASWWRWKESEKSGLKLNIKKTEIMLTTNRRGKSGSSDRFYFLGLQITADCDCIHEIQRHLLLGS